MEDLQKKLRVSVLIVSRNCAESLRRCLSAIDRSLERESMEVLVVDNGSLDETSKLDSEFPSVHFLRLPKNFGLTKAANIGIRTAKGQMLLFLRPDAEVAPDAISTLAARLESIGNAGAVCPFVDHAYPLPKRSDLAVAWRTGGLPGRTSLDPGADAIPVEYPMGAPILLPRRFLAGMNYLDQRFGQHWADADLCFQIRSSGKKIFVIPAARIHQPSESPLPQDAVNSADSALGAAAYVGKRFGSGAGMRFRLAAILHVLGRSLTLRRPGYNLQRLSALVSGQKIDGTQAQT